MTTRARIQAIATAVPPYVLDQAAVAEQVRIAFEHRMPEYPALARVFATSGIKTRQAVRPIEWYLQPHSWSERTSVYLETATELLISAARRALSSARLSGADVDSIVTVSSTGIATPSLEARAAGMLGLRHDVARVPVFGLGCAGGVTGLSLAARLAEARPGSNVLLVVIELCTLAVRLDRSTKANIVALALFGDGAAAAVVRAGDAGLATLEAAAEHTWPESLGIMGWEVDAEGLSVLFDRSIPPFAARHLAPAVGDIARRQGFGTGEIGRFVCHPGGRKVIEAIESSLALRPETLDHERAVLAAHGNMSAPSALFVLERVLRGGLPDRALLMALGPGFTLSTATLARAA